MAYLTTLFVFRECFVTVFISIWYHVQGQRNKPLKTLRFKVNIMNPVLNTPENQHLQDTCLYSAIVLGVYGLKQSSQHKCLVTNVIHHMLRLVVLY